MSVTTTADGSVLDGSGKCLLFSEERFVRDICEGGCCLICGALPSSKPFSEEHVLPKWILKRYGLFDSRINLPNLTDFRYDQYTISICADCNERMGEVLEQPMREVIASGPNSMQRHMGTHGPALPFVWMALIFLKTHLKDREFRQHLDKRKGDRLISDTYDWSVLRLAHCIARAWFVDTTISPRAFGSMLVLPALPQKKPFDFADLYEAQALMLRLDDVIVYCVINDSCGAIQGYRPIAERITGPLSWVQAREVLAELAFMNLSMKARPKHRTSISPTGEAFIDAETPSHFELGELDMTLRGRLMAHLLSPVLPGMAADKRELLDQGQLTFLFNDARAFIQESGGAAPIEE